MRTDIDVSTGNSHDFAIPAIGKVGSQLSISITQRTTGCCKIITTPTYISSGNALYTVGRI